jgi:predicted cupin superfamily sugar epimerase
METVTAQLSASDLVRILQLTPHPEGGFFRETYRAEGRSGSRSASTAIYFLLPQGHVSRLHRIRSDEVWHLYLGGPLDIVELQANGPAKVTRLGLDLNRDERPQHVVPGGTWFGSMPAPGVPFALVGCTVAPGFEFDDFEMGSRDALLTEFPQARDLIMKLT